MELVSNKELCQVIWGLIIKNVMHKRSFTVSELLAGRFKVPLREYKYICILTRGGRRGWGGGVGVSFGLDKTVAVHGDPYLMSWRVFNHRSFPVR